MSQLPEAHDDPHSRIEAHIGKHHVGASGDAAARLVDIIGPFLYWPIIASAISLVILAGGLALSWTVFR